MNHVERIELGADDIAKVALLNRLGPDEDPTEALDALEVQRQIILSQPYVTASEETGDARRRLHHHFSKGPAGLYIHDHGDRLFPAFQFLTADHRRHRAATVISRILQEQGRQANATEFRMAYWWFTPRTGLSTPEAYPASLLHKLSPGVLMLFAGESKQFFADPTTLTH